MTRRTSWISSRKNSLNPLTAPCTGLPPLRKPSSTWFRYTYDLVILDIMGVRGFDLLQIATNANFPVVMLTAHAFTPEALKKSIELGARAYLPKEKLGSLVPFLEDVLKLNYQSAWKKALDQVGTLFNKKFGSDWRKSQEEFWDDFEKKLSVDEAAIIK